MDNFRKRRREMAFNVKGTPGSKDLGLDGVAYRIYGHKTDQKIAWWGMGKQGNAD